MHRVNNAIRLQTLDELPIGRLLDVGCGKGRFLSAARAAGWDVLGVEFADGAATTAKAMFNVDVVTGDFLDVPVGGPFDVVTMWHTMEHLPDPNAALVRTKELLRPGGRVVVSVPNSSSAQARLGGDAWFHLDVPRHLYHFTPVSLTALLTRCGFEIERIDHFYPEMEMIGVVQTCLNRLGLGQDTLYRFAKRDGTAGRGIRLAASAILAAALLPFALIWSILAPAFRTGASIQVVARLR